MNLLTKLAATFALACTASGTAVAQAPLQPTPAAAAVDATAAMPNAAAAPLTESDLSTFFGGLVPYMLKRGDIAGGVVVVVKDGKVLFAEGYGHADLKTRAPVSTATTLFRIGSVSKLFTWTAVMQLVQAGKLNLDRDINAYLDFRIPPAFGKPITLRDLMTHTPGFEDTARDLLPATPAGTNLERYLKAHVPARIFPPGKIVAYSNYGAGLAGYIVQRVSGEPFDDYIRQHILQPLDMQHSTFAQPLPANLAPLLAKGYASASDGVAKPFELANPAPAGAMTSSALDMANFMIAQLQDGRFGDTRILSRATAELMHSPQYTAAPGLNGFDLGFYQENRNGQRIIGHGGDTIVFHTDLHLLLDADVGLFVAFNSEGRNGAVNDVRSAIFHAFLDRYFPYRAPPLPTATTARADAARVTGWYESSRRNQSALSLLYLLGAQHVVAQADGTLTISGMTDAAGAPLHWREIGPLRYRQVHGQSLVEFVADAHGRIRYFASGEDPTELYQRLPASHSLGTFGPLVLIATLVILVALLTWIAGGWMHRHYRQPLALTSGQRHARLLSRLGAVALALVVLGWLALIVTISVDVLLLVRGGLVPWMYLLYALGVLALIGTLAIVANAVQAWFSPRRGRWTRAGEILLSLAAIYLAWFIVAMRLVSFNVHF
ncbi:MAG: serine hydrolase [Rhodanobacteraceae bacterium]|nr:MAG: serine hydrolase [Rhodanobacteraceae bacterium]